MGQTKDNTLARVVILFLIHVIFAFKIYAQDVDSLSPTHVTGSEVHQRNPSHAMVYTQAELKRFGNTTLGDFLQKQGLYQSRQSGGAGSRQSLSIRGLNLKYIAISVDGILLSTQSNPQDVIQSIPIDQIQSIKIHYINPDSRALSTHGGSLIEIVTIPQDEVSARVLHGRFEETLGAFTASHHNRSGLWNLRYQGHYALNNFEYMDNNQTPYNSSDDSSRTRINNDFTTHQTSLSHQVQLGQHQFKQRLQHDWRKNGLAGYESHQTRDSYFQEFQYNYLFQYQSLQAHPLSFDFSHTYRQDEMYWTRDDELWITPKRENTWKNEQRITQAILSKIWNATETSQWGLAFNSHLEQQRALQFQPSIILEAEDFDWNRSTQSLGLDYNHLFNQWNHHLAYQQLFIYDFNSELDHQEFNYNFQLSTQYLFHPKWNAAFGFSRLLQMARLQDKFGLSSGVVPNPDLNNETGYKTYLGLNFQNSNLSWRADVFGSYLQDRIHYKNTYNLTKAVNELNVLNYGLETQLDYDHHWDDQWSHLIQIQGTVQFPRLHGDLHDYDQNIPANISPLTTSLNNFQRWGNLTWAHHIRYYHRHYADDSNEQDIPHQFWFDTWIQYSFSDLDFQTGIDNYTATQDLRTYRPLPIPSRRWYLELKYQFL